MEIAIQRAIVRTRRETEIAIQRAIVRYFNRHETRTATVAPHTTMTLNSVVI